MPRRPKYQLDRILVEPADSRPATWTFGGESQRGTEQSFHVTDTNFPSRNAWEFIVRIPQKPADRVEVRPRTAPSVAAWAELPDRSLTFMRATRGEARGRRYCQVALADASGERSRAIVRTDQRGALPPWFDALRGRMRIKENVKPTKGTDARTLVLLVAEGDYAAMIRLFFALKVWVLKEGFEMPA
ncbi:MAG TPA: hypothetical protein VFW66_03775 [Gemmatimonadales bacterium]|nr:hypothetical protein [Gemmatimonadales bacterium]